MSPPDYIAAVVRAFYQKATTDVLIGYHFQRIPDFATHLPRIFAFWELQLLGQTSATLAPPLDVINAHVPLKIHRGEVGRWVKLFGETLEELAPLDEHGLREKWTEKIAHFQGVFLRHPHLFGLG